MIGDGLLSRTAIQFAWRALSVRAGLEGELSFVYGQPYEWAGPAPAVFVRPAPSNARNALRRLPENTLDWLPARMVMPGQQKLPIGDRLPVLFWGQEARRSRFAQLMDNGTLVVDVDIIAATVFMLSRWEETGSSVRDQHGRFPASASAAWRHGFLDRPVIDEYALVLRAWLREMMPGWQPRRNRFQVFLHHDIDTLRRFTPERGLLGPRGGLRTLAATLVRDRSMKGAGATLRELYASAKQPETGQAMRGVRRLAQLADEYQFPATFFFMTAVSSPRDVGYPLDSPLGKAALEMVRQYGHSIAFHPGYQTPDNRQQRQTELAAFRRVTAVSAPGVRQHYLRLRVPDTWHYWAAVGLPYDASLGYADQPGFRAGTCHPFQPFDLARDETVDIEVRPLIVMDQTLISEAYLGLDAAEASRRALTLAERCRAVEGVYVLLWHNTMMSPPWDGCYVRILERLRQLIDGGAEYE